MAKAHKVALIEKISLPGPLDGPHSICSVDWSPGTKHANQSACSSTAQAIAIAEDWIKNQRARRVIVLGADDVTNPSLLEWIGAEYLQGRQAPRRKSRMQLYPLTNADIWIGARYGRSWFVARAKV